VAIAVGGLTTPDSDTAMFPNDPQMVLFSGKIRKGENVYLHKLPFYGTDGKPQFVQGAHDREFYSMPGVKGIKPVEIKAVPVDKYLNLIRTATPNDLELRKQNMKEGVAEGSLTDKQQSYWDNVAKEKKDKEREALKSKKTDKQQSYWDNVAKEKKDKEREALKSKKAEYEKTPVGKAEKYWSKQDVAEERTSAAVRMQRAMDRQRAKSDASLRRTPSSIPKPDPKKDKPTKETKDSGSYAANKPGYSGEANYTAQPNWRGMNIGEDVDDVMACAIARLIESQLK
jgi:hypothetical protein